MDKVQKAYDLLLEYITRNSNTDKRIWEAYYNLNDYFVSQKFKDLLERHDD